MSSASMLVMDNEIGVLVTSMVENIIAVFYGKSFTCVCNNVLILE